MPGVPSNTPTRPFKVWTFSKDRFCLSSTIELWIAFPFGVGFSAVGVGLLFQYLRLVLATFDIKLPLPQQPPDSDLPLWNILLGFPLFAMFAFVFLFFGTMLLQSLSVTFDRAQRLVTVRSGWMGLWRRSFPFSAIQKVCVAPRKYFLLMRRPDNYDIVLTSESDTPIVIGVVTCSPNLAWEVVQEICDFTGLKAT